MKKTVIPVYDICTISESRNDELLVEQFGSYLKKHYQNLHLPHRHSFYHLVLFTHGKGTHTIDFVKFNVKPFQMYFMIPGQVHSWHFEGETDGYLVHFSESFFRSFLQDQHYLERFGFFSGNSEEGICQLPETIRKEVVRLFEGLLKETKEPDDASRDMIRLRLLELFITLERSCAGKSKKKIPQQKYILLRHFQKLIDQNYRTIKLPKEYAGLLYVTPNHLNALCNDLLGKTAGEMIRDRVLLEAKRLLTNMDMNVAEIAGDLNFEDPSYFNRFFKKYTGTTPEEFRTKFINQ